MDSLHLYPPFICQRKTHTVFDFGLLYYIIKEINIATVVYKAHSSYELIIIRHVAHELGLIYICKIPKFFWFLGHSGLILATYNPKKRWDDPSITKKNSTEGSTSKNQKQLQKR